ncbi:MAG TPA: FecR family protein [Planctomycetota bacterium]
MKSEDLIQYLDGECPPEAQEDIERGLLSDPAALALFRRLCRQRLMLAQTLGRNVLAARPRSRVAWQTAAAAALFAATLLALWTRQDPVIPPGPRVLRGEVFAAGHAIRHIPPGAPVEVPAGSTADIRLKDGTDVVLHPSSQAVFHGAAEGLRETMELGRGKADFRVPVGGEPFLLHTPLGILAVRGAEFAVELVPDADPRGKPMKTMLVTVLAGGVRIDVAGKTLDLRAGEARAFRSDGAVADSLRGLKNREGDRQGPVREKQR